MSASNASTPRTPLAGGQPISAEVADQAAEWLTVLMSGTASAAQLRDWEHWRAAHPDHARAWAHLEAVTGRLKTLAPQAAYRSLSPYADGKRPASPGRRKALNLVLWGGVAGATGLLATRTQRWQQATADYATATGQRRVLQLDDGTRLTLNTRSAVDVRFDTHQRLLDLVAGEIMVVTAHALGAAQDPRPLLVRTVHGDVRALGTRFAYARTRRRAGSPCWRARWRSARVMPLTPRAACRPASNACSTPRSCRRPGRPMRKPPPGSAGS